MHEKTFTISEAREAIPEMRRLMLALREEKASLVRLHPYINEARAHAEQNGGTPFGALYLKHAFSFATALDEVERTGAIIKDFNAGLIDFPHEHEGRIIYLCWKLGEDDLSWWHEVDDGFAGRQPIDAIHDKSH
jgi:hypothetical protein